MKCEARSSRLPRPVQTSPQPRTARSVPDPPQTVGGSGKVGNQSRTLTRPPRSPVLPPQLAVISRLRLSAKPPLHALLVVCLQNPWVDPVGGKFQVRLVIKGRAFMKESLSFYEGNTDVRMTKSSLPPFPSPGRQIPWLGQASLRAFSPAVCLRECEGYEFLKCFGRLFPLAKIFTRIENTQCSARKPIKQDRDTGRDLGTSKTERTYLLLNIILF